jgi:hypothetical protein
MIWKFNLWLYNGTRIVYKDSCKYMRRKSLSSRKRFRSVYIKEMKLTEKRTKLRPPTMVNSKVAT